MIQRSHLIVADSVHARIFAHSALRTVLLSIVNMFTHKYRFHYVNQGLDEHPHYSALSLTF